MQLWFYIAWNESQETSFLGVCVCARARYRSVLKLCFCVQSASCDNNIVV